MMASFPELQELSPLEASVKVLQKISFDRNLPKAVIDEVNYTNAVK